jgi:hypothetical protein
VLLRNARPFSTGLPAGFSDLFGLVPTVITQDMVGQQFARFLAMEVKGPKGRLSDKQAAFLRAVSSRGGLSGVARSADDALAIIKGDVP